MKIDAKLKLKVKIGVAVATVIFIVICCLIGIATAKETERKLDSMDRVIYTVKSGDTLWGFAEENCPEGIDLRMYIDKIEELNHCSSNLQIGQKLIILVAAEETN